MMRAAYGTHSDILEQGGNVRSISSVRPTASAPSSRDLSAAPTEELVPMARLGSSSALRELYRRYTPFVHKIGRKFFLPGAETEDLIQEGLAGLHHAIKTFAADRGREFEDYASMCVRNQMMRSLRHATRRKHMVLTEASSLTTEAGTTVERPCNRPSPEDEVLGALATSDWMRLIATCLSDLEREVLLARVTGESNADLSDRLAVERKQLENALFRARKKLVTAAQREDLLLGVG